SRRRGRASRPQSTDAAVGPLVGCLEPACRAPSDARRYRAARDSRPAGGVVGARAAVAAVPRAWVGAGVARLTGVRPAITPIRRSDRADRALAASDARASTASEGAGGAAGAGGASGDPARPELGPRRRVHVSRRVPAGPARRGQAAARHLRLAPRAAGDRER